MKLSNWTICAFKQLRRLITETRARNRNNCLPAATCSSYLWNNGRNKWKIPANPPCPTPSGQIKVAAARSQMFARPSGPSRQIESDPMRIGPTRSGRRKGAQVLFRCVSGICYFSLRTVAISCLLCSHWFVPCSKMEETRSQKSIRWSLYMSAILLPTEIRHDQRNFVSF